VGDQFDRIFWPKYPKKVSKQAALKAYRKLKPSPDLLTRIIEDIDARLTRGAWDAVKAKNYIPNPATYLNNRGWEDEIIPRPEFKAPVDYSELARTTEEIRV
jgi:hypothetical protein